MNQERSSEREGDGIMNNKNKSLADKIPKRVWLLISFAVAMLFWYILSIILSTASKAYADGSTGIIAQSEESIWHFEKLSVDFLQSKII